MNPALIANDAITVRDLPARKLTAETCRRFGYGVAQLNGSGDVHVAPYYDAAGTLVAQKVRTRDKQFSVRGSMETALPFGANVWPRTGRMLVVTEGEIDALSMSQVQGNRWPVVSLGCGAGAQTAKYVARHREYFSGFEKVVLMMDADEPGRAAARAAARVLGARAHIAELPLKDPNEMLVAGRVEELLTAMWRAAPYRPEGIVEIKALHDQVMAEPVAGLSWWAPSLTRMTHGIRTGEIYTLGAGTGAGKTDFVAQQVVHLATAHRVPVGYFALEQAPRETALRLLGKYAGRAFHVPDGGWTATDKREAWDGWVDAGAGVFLYDSFGANRWDAIKEKLEFLAHAEGVRHFVLDHLTALAAAEDDERVALERIMADMGAIVKRLDCALILVSHLATPEGRPHEEGGRVMARHFKGSRAIGYWSHFLFGLERDQQAEDVTIRQEAALRCLKDRYTGRGTGKVVWLGYDTATGRLVERDAVDASGSPAPGAGDGAAAIPF